MKLDTRSTDSPSTFLDTKIVWREQMQLVPTVPPLTKGLFSSSDVPPNAKDSSLESLCGSKSLMIMNQYRSN